MCPAFCIWQTPTVNSMCMVALFKAEIPLLPAVIFCIKTVLSTCTAARLQEAKPQRTVVTSVYCLYQMHRLYSISAAAILPMVLLMDMAAIFTLEMVMSQFPMRGSLVAQQITTLHIPVQIMLLPFRVAVVTFLLLVAQP